MKEKETPKSLYDYLEERGEAIGTNDAIVISGTVGEGKSLSSQNMAYCSNCEDLVHFTEQDEVLEEEFKGGQKQRNYD